MKGSESNADCACPLIEPCRDERSGLRVKRLPTCSTQALLWQGFEIAPLLPEPTLRQAVRRPKFAQLRPACRISPGQRTKRGSNIDANRARPLLEACRPFLMEADPVWGPHLAMAPVVCMSYLWIEQFSTARALLARFIDAARVAGAPGLLPFPLSALAEIDFRSGAWDEAYSGLHEAVELARQTGQAVHLPRLLSGLARVEAQRGDTARCRAHIGESTALALSGTRRPGSPNPPRAHRRPAPPRPSHRRPAMTTRRLG